MKRDLKNYLTQVERTYYYRIKSILPLGEISGIEKERVDALRRLERIEQACARYNPVSFEPVRRTMIQHMPLDFVNVQNREVFILDVVLSLPVSPVVLRQACKIAANIPEEFIVVHGESDPIETAIEIADAYAEMSTEAQEKGWVSAALLDDPHNSEEENDHSGLYGNEANSRFLRYLQTVRSERGELPGDVEGDAFNANIADAPEVNPAPCDTDEASKAVREMETEIRRTYRDKEGNLHTLTRKITKIGRGEGE